MAVLPLQSSSTHNWNGMRLTWGLYQEVVQEAKVGVAPALVEATLYHSGMMIWGVHIIQLMVTHLLPYSAQAGFNRGDGTDFYALPGSGTSEILALGNTSYINMSGVWLFRVDGDVSIGGVCESCGVHCKIRNYHKFLYIYRYRRMFVESLPFRCDMQQYSW